MALSTGQRFEQVFRKVLKYRGSRVLSEASVKDIIKHFLISRQSQCSAGHQPEPRDFFTESTSTVQMSNHHTVPRSRPRTEECDS